jgi:hypothetical protein
MAQYFSPAQQVVRALKEDSTLASQPDAIAVVQEAANKVDAIWVKDRLLFRMAVGVLGALAIIAALGALLMAAFGKTTPESVVALGSASVGALVGLFAPSPTSNQ